MIAARHSLGSLLDEISAEVADLQIAIRTIAYAYYPYLGKETGSAAFVPYPKNLFKTTSCTTSTHPAVEQSGLAGRVPGSARGPDREMPG